MITYKKALLGLAAAASVLTLASAGAAQDGPPRGPRGDGPRAEGRGPGGGMRGDPAMREQRLRQRLTIRADQEAAFKTFLAATNPPAEPPPRPDPEAMRSLPTPQRLDGELARARTQLAEMQARNDATKRFYGVLSAEQRQTFDQTPMAAGPPGGPGRGPGGRGGRGPGGRGGPGGPGGGQDQQGPAYQ